MTLVKICGLTRPEDVDAVNGLRPDMVGFVFYGPSRRCVSKETAETLASSLGRSITKVGVFVDEDPLVIADIVDSGIIDAVQLHGVEDSAYIHGLRRLTDAPMVKACDADMVLMDAGMGSGRLFDWSLLERMDRDYILSGGLSPDNVTKALERLHPFGVDVSSGVETDGRKDPEKILRFVRSVRGSEV